MLMLSNLTTVQGWIEAYKNKYVWGVNYVKSWVGAYQVPAYISALEGFCAAKKAAPEFSATDLVTLGILLINWAKAEPHTFAAIAPLSPPELTVLTRLLEDAKLDETFYLTAKWDGKPFNAAETTAHYTIFFNFIATILTHCARPLTDERYTFILTLARRLLCSEPQSITHDNILKMQHASAPLPANWSKHIAHSDNPFMLMQAYFKLQGLTCLTDEANQQALIAHANPDVLADTVVKATHNKWDDERIQILFKSQNPEEVFDVITGQGDDRRILPFINGAKSPVALAQLYQHGKTIGLDNETLTRLLTTGKNYPSHLEHYLELPIFREKVAIDFLIANKFNYATLRLVAELRPEDKFILETGKTASEQPFAFVSDIVDFYCAYQTAKNEKFLSRPMLEVMLNVQNSQQLVRNMSVANRLEILGKDLLPLFALELPETEQHLFRLKQLKEQGKLNAQTFSEFMHEIELNAKQAKPKDGASVTELSLFSHTQQLESTGEVKPATRPRRSAKR